MKPRFKGAARRILGFLIAVVMCGSVGSRAAEIVCLSSIAGSQVIVSDIPPWEMARRAREAPLDLSKYGTLVETPLDLSQYGTPVETPNEATHWIQERLGKKFPLGARPTNQSYCEVAVLKGPIVAGDYERFLSFYRQHHPFLDHLFIQSPGGRADEAIRIGTLLRRYLVEATAPQLFDGRGLLTFRQAICSGKDCICASACALIWFGAPLRSGDVGLHRPHFRDQRFGKLPGDQAMSMYKKQLEDVVAYMSGMGVHKAHIDTMIETEPDEIKWLESFSGAEPVNLRRSLDYFEWVRSACAVLSPREYFTMITIGGNPKSRTERVLYEELSNRNMKANDCEHILRNSNRERLPAP